MQQSRRHGLKVCRFSLDAQQRLWRRWRLSLSPSASKKAAMFSDRGTRARSFTLSREEWSKFSLLIRMKTHDASPFSATAITLARLR